MRLVFTLRDTDRSYQKLAKVLVVSVKVNSKAELICLYDGNDNEFISWLQISGITCIRRQVPFFNEIKEKYKGKKSIDYCAGAYLNLEIPNALLEKGIHDQFVMYVDTDTMILNKLELDSIKPDIVAITPDWEISNWKIMGGGIIVMNLKRLREDYSNFINHLRKHNFDFAFAGQGPCSQGAWNTFYKGSWGRLGPEYDWKPWWGYNSNAKIIHFSGPKPNEVKAILSNLDENPNENERQKINRYVIRQNPDSYKKYLQIWNRYEKMTMSS